MAKKKAVKTPRPKATTDSDHISRVVQHVTIQEPQPGKFKILIGQHDGLVWKCYPWPSGSIEKARGEYLRSIRKTSASFLTQEQIDDFLKLVENGDFRVKMPATEWKKHFARRFQRFLDRKGITLEQIEDQGFSDPASKRWLRNLYKNGICTETNINTLDRMLRLFKVLGIKSSEEF